MVFHGDNANFGVNSVIVDGSKNMKPNREKSDTEIFYKGKSKIRLTLLCLFSFFHGHEIVKPRKEHFSGSF